MEKAGETGQAELKLAIEKWGEQRRIQTFFLEAELAIKQLPEAEQPSLLKRIELARSMLGTADALQEIRNWGNPAEHYELFRKATYW